MDDDAGAREETPAEKNIFDTLTTGEKVLGGAAWLFIISYVIGNRLVEDWVGSVVVWVAMLSLLIMVAMYLHHFGSDAIWHPFYPTIVRAAAWGIVVLAALDLVNSIFNEFGSSLFFWITFYVASGAIGAGAYLMRQEWSAGLGAVPALGAALG